MNVRTNAVQLGMRRGWIEFKQSMRSAQDWGFNAFMVGAVLGYLFLRRNSEVEGTDLMVPAVSMPSILGALIAFGVVIGPAYSLAMQREDGTLLRLKAIPNGLSGYVVGQLVLPGLGVFVTSGPHRRAQLHPVRRRHEQRCQRLGHAGRIHDPRTAGHVADRHRHRCTRTEPCRRSARGE